MLLTTFVTCIAIATGALTTLGQKYIGIGDIPGNGEFEEYIDENDTDDGDWNDDGPEIWRWTVQEFPHPQLQPKHCQRFAPSNVCNPDQVLTNAQASQLDLSIRALFNDTPCICDNCDASADGIQLGIAIFKNIYKPYNERASKTVQLFTKNLRSKWRLGDCNDDILIVVVTDDRLSYTDVGDETSRYIPQDEAYAIFLENIAHFSAKRYYIGLSAMLEKYQEVAKRIPREPPKKKFDVAKVVGGVIGALFLLAIIALAIIWVYKKYRKKSSESGSESNGGEVASSTWRKKIPLTAGHISSPDSYAPVKTIEEVVIEEIDNQCAEETTHPSEEEEETATTTESPGKPTTTSDNSPSTERTSSPTNDDIEAVQTENIFQVPQTHPFTTFIPAPKKELHQTNL